MNRSVSRRLERLETQRAAATPVPMVIRILFVSPVEGLTGVLVFGADGTTKEPGTPEEKEGVRAQLARREAARLSGV
jgi:hypothetical protein